MPTAPLPPPGGSPWHVVSAPTSSGFKNEGQNYETPTDHDFEGLEMLANLTEDTPGFSGTALDEYSSLVHAFSE